jgi:uncharacterized protein (TIGR02284 family)
MNNEKTTEVLNTLVVINNDRIEGYNTASENTEERDLKTLFSKFAETSQSCRNELVREIQKLGGKVEEGTNVSGKFFRVWMDVKSALTGKDRKAILNSCEQGEEKAVETYRNVSEDKSIHLPLDLITLIRTQHGLLKVDLGMIKTMQNAL